VHGEVKVGTEQISRHCGDPLLVGLVHNVVALSFGEKEFPD